MSYDMNPAVRVFLLKTLSKLWRFDYEAQPHNIEAFQNDVETINKLLKLYGDNAINEQSIRDFQTKSGQRDKASHGDKTILVKY